jgi:hypothetical protein
MCKEIPVILVNRVVDKKRIIGKMEGLEGGEAQGVADQKSRPSRGERRGRFIPRCGLGLKICLAYA